MRYLILLFIIVPALEIGLFIVAGKTFGSLTTIGLIIFTGIIGAYLAKRQGLEVLQKLKDQLQLRMPPGVALLEGICVLFGGILLIAPGFITDLLGLLLVLPKTRKMFIPLLLRLIKNWTDRRHIYIFR